MEEKDFLESLDSSLLDNSGGFEIRSLTASKKSKRRTELELKAKRKNILGPFSSQPLSEAEISEDLFLIFGQSYNLLPAKRSNWTDFPGFLDFYFFVLETKSSSTGSNFQDYHQLYNYLTYYREQDASLIYDSITYRKGDDIMVERDDQEEIFGEISSLNSNEVRKSLNQLDLIFICSWVDLGEIDRRVSYKTKHFPIAAGENIHLPHWNTIKTTTIYEY